MDIKAYIESGIIESYVLGLASTQESIELEQLSAQYAEVQQAIDEFASLMEKNAFENAIAPPADIRNSLMLTLSGEFAEEEKNISVAPVLPVANVQAAPVKRMQFWKYVAAASIILFVGSGLLNIYFYNNYKSADDKYQALLIERNSLQANNDAYKTKLNILDDNFKLISDTSVKVINMKGIKGRENNLATVYWNIKTNDVYLSASHLTQTPEGKQYQLWAIVDGKPVNAGMIGDCDGLCKMINISHAQAFAITLEPKGGSVSPTLPAMFVMGGV